MFTVEDHSSLIEDKLILPNKLPDLITANAISTNENDETHNEHHSDSSSHHDSRHILKLFKDTSDKLHRVKSIIYFRLSFRQCKYLISVNSLKLDFCVIQNNY